MVKVNNFLIYINETSPDVHPYDKYDPATIPFSYWDFTVLGLYCGYEIDIIGVIFVTFKYCCSL
jgi:hypothetical protein